jgi:glycosyltransferase involved in cell wall biosynthesis
MPLQALAERGVDVTCVFPVIRAAPEYSGERFRIEAVRLPRVLPILSYLWFFTRVWPLFLRLGRNVDWVVVEAADAFVFAPAILWAAVACRRPRFAIRETSVPVDTSSTHSQYHRISHHLSMLFSRYSAAVFAISPMRAKEICMKYRIPDVHVWPPSVDTGLFNPAKHGNARIRIRRSLGIGDRILLIHHGALTHERGLYELVQAIRIVHDERQDISLLFLGKGRAESKLRELVRSSGLDEMVIFHKPVPYNEVPEFIAAADIGVVPLPDHPQWRHQTPTKLLEYMAMGKPVIITDIAAHRSMLKDYKDAYFCKRGRPNEIAEAIMQWLRSKPKVRADYGKEIARSFSPAAIAGMLLETLEFD